GKTTAQYRWLAIVYIVSSFFIIPTIVCALSLAGWYVFGGVLGPVVLLIIIVVIINVLQSHRPTWLPSGLRSWSWLPRPLRTLSWYDEHLFRKQCCCCRRKQKVPPETSDEVHQNNDCYAGDDQDDATYF
ncbi:unnamed protein product, partial [Adineta ricciae]